MKPRKYKKHPSRRAQTRVRVARGTVHVFEGKSYVVRGFTSNKKSVFVVVETDDGEMEKIPTARFLTEIAPGDPVQGAVQRYDRRNTMLYELLTPAEQAYVDDWVGHLAEVEFGDKLATSPEPRPGVDPDALDPRYDLSVPITQRRASKSAELAKAGTYKGTSVASLSEKARHAVRGGPRGIGILFDGRTGLELDSLGALPEKVVDIAKAVTLEHAQDYVGSMHGTTREADLLAALYKVGLADAVTERSTKLLLDRVGAGLGLNQVASVRESQKGRPDPGYGGQDASRPGEIFQLDCTPLNQFCVSDGEFVKAEVLTAIDVYSRMVVGVRVVAGAHTSQDVNLLLFDALSSRFRREHWNPEPKDPFLGAPDGLSIPDNRTFIPPGTAKAVMDRGRQFDNRKTRAILSDLSIQVYTTPPGGGWAKGIVESFQKQFASLVQGLPGDKGASPRDRAKGAGKTLIGPTIALAERMIIEFVTLEYHFAKHSGLRENGKLISPFAKFRRYVDTFGEITAFVDPNFIFRFLEHDRRNVYDDGVHIRGEIYYGPALRGLEVSRRGSLAPKVMVFFDRRDKSRVWVLHPDTGEYLEVPKAAKTRRVVHVGGETTERARASKDVPQRTLKPKQRKIRRGQIREEARQQMRESAVEREQRRAAAREPLPKPAVHVDDGTVVSLDDHRERQPQQGVARPRKPYTPPRRLSW